MRSTMVRGQLRMRRIVRLHQHGLHRAASEALGARYMHGRCYYRWIWWIDGAFDVPSAAGPGRLAAECVKRLREKAEHNPWPLTAHTCTLRYHPYITAMDICGTCDWYSQSQHTPWPPCEWWIFTTPVTITLQVKILPYLTITLQLKWINITRRHYHLYKWMYGIKVTITLQIDKYHTV